MAINWTDVLVNAVTTVGGGGALLAAAAWLIKKVLTDRLARDAEAFKTRLRADADAEIERLKSSLQMAALEHQVRFSKLHEKRAEVIAELYRRLVEVAREGKLFVLTGEGSPTLKEEFANAQNNVRELILFVDTNRIYVPAGICDLLDEFTTTLSLAVIDVGVYGSIEDPHENLRSERDNVFKNAYQAVETSIPEIKKQLDVEFRAILGETPANR